MKFLTKEEIASVIKQTRLKAGFTQTEAAKAIGRKQQTLASWETGQSQPDANTLFQLFDLYGASVDEAFGYTKKSPAPANAETEDLTKQEFTLLHNFRTLNDEGQNRLLETSDDMVASGKYTKNNSSEIPNEA